jgi:hypothetical protein
VLDDHARAPDFLVLKGEWKVRADRGHVRQTRQRARSSKQKCAASAQRGVLVKWSFSRRLGGDVSHTRQGVVNTPLGLI